MRRTMSVVAETGIFVLRRPVALFPKADADADTDVWVREHLAKAGTTLERLYMGPMTREGARRQVRPACLLPDYCTAERRSCLSGRQ